MKRMLRVGGPAFAASVILLVAALVEVWMTMVGRPGYHIDIIFNVILVEVAVLGAILVGLPTQAQHELQFAGLLSNLLISIIAFPMNIAVFGHRINWRSPVEDLWGGHIGWLFCAALQILFFSGLGTQLLSLVYKLRALVARGIIAVGRGFSAVGKAIRAHDKGIIAIMTVSIVVWAMFLACKVYQAGTFETLADIDTLIGNLLVWITCALVGTIMYNTPLIITGVNSTLRPVNSRRVPVAVIIATALVLLCVVLPPLLEKAGLLVAVVILPLCLAGLIIGCAVWRVRKKGKATVPGEDPRPDHTIHPVDFVIVLLAFCVIPLILINVVTALSPSGQEILNREQVGVKNCLDYITVCCNVASAVIQLLT